MPDRVALRAKSRLIHGHGEVSVADTLNGVADWCRERGVDFDAYGSGTLIESFQSEVAELLGYPAARFMPSGTMAQQIALRVWCEHKGLNLFGMHPTSHLEIHEQHGYSFLHRMTASLIGPADRPMLAEDLAERADPMAAILVELPTREIGGQLPSLDQLQLLKTAIRERGIALHLDGARLWECGPAYEKPYDSICTGFDSCYVSFYKGIGALPGAMLLGNEDFIAEATIWQRRSGGNLYTMTPNVASAAMLWKERLERMPTYLERAHEIGAVLSSTEGVTVVPDPPHINMFHITLDMTQDEALAARDLVADELGLWLFGWTTPTDDAGRCSTEVYVGEAAMEVKDDEIGSAFEMLVTVRP